MSYGALTVLLVVAVGCGSPKKPPPESAFVLNPPAIVARKASAADSGVAKPDTAKPESKAPKAESPKPRAAAPVEQKRETPKPPPAPDPVPAAVVATAAEDRSTDPSLYFDDDFARGNHCDLGHSHHGFGWNEAQAGKTDSVLAVRDAASPSGCALAFIFQGNNDPADDAWAEQRFKLGKSDGDELHELFVGFVLVTPPNYRHRKPKGADNNKLLRLWDRDYNKSMVHVGMSTTGRSNPPGSSQMIVEYSTPKGTGNFNLGPYTPVMRPGGVDTVGFYVRTSSGIGTPDGVIRVWWNRRLVYEHTDLPLAKPQASPGAFNALGNGYLLGWSNSGFDQRTEFHVWRFVLAPHPVPWFLPAGR